MGKLSVKRSSSGCKAFAKGVAEQTLQAWRMVQERRFMKQITESSVFGGSLTEDGQTDHAF
jgi:hypothetical protein